MIPSRQDLEGIAGRREGRLEEVPFAVLLLAHAVHERTAVLELGRRQIAKRIALEAGVPVDCRSNLAHETLGRFMMSAGRLGEQDFTVCLGESAARGVPLGEVLLERGLVGAADLFRILQQNLAKKLLDLFTWREGEFRLLDPTGAADSSLKVRVPQLVVTGVTRFAPQREVDAGVVPLVGRTLGLPADARFPVADLKLSPRQMLLVEALRPGRRIDELAAATGLPYDEITRLLYALAVLGTVVPIEAPRPKAAVPASAPASPPPTAATPRVDPIAAPRADPIAAPRPQAAAVNPAAAVDPLEAAGGSDAGGAAAGPAVASGRGAAMGSNELMQAYLAYRRQDPFDLLGLPEDAMAPAIEARWLDFARRFAPWSFAAPDLEEKARDLFLAGARAYAQLADPEQRGTLLFRRRTLREERAKGPAERPRIKTDLLDPEVQYRKARAHMDAGRFKDAIQLLEFASDCDPGNGLYRAELAWSRFAHSPTTAGRQAVTDLEETLRIDPRCGLALLYLGEIQGELGHREEAETHLRRAIKAMAPDRRPIEALKALQAQKRR